MNKKINGTIFKLIKVNKCLDINFYTGAIRLGDLFKVMDVPIYRAGSSNITAADSGYQRAAKPARIMAVKNRINTPLIGLKTPNTEPFVDNVNLNITASDAEAYVKPINNGEDDFGDFFDFTYIDSFGVIRIVDGQTRLRGAEEAYKTARTEKDFNLADDIANTRVQITLTFCNDIYKEAYVFYLINQYSKAIPPDGATRLLFEGMKKNDINFVNEVTRSGKAGEIESMGVAERLNHNSQVWSANIKDFNESGGSKMSIRAVAKTIMPIYKIVNENNASNIKTSEDITYDVVEAFWVGFRNAYPMIFDQNTSSAYNALKAGPSEIMMKVLGKIYSLSVSGAIKDKMNQAKTFESILKPVLKNYSDNTPNNKSVHGEKLFLVGKQGAMGKYSNNAAKNDAARLINREVFKHFNLPVT